MSPTRLLEHFEQISDAPDAVPRLRRFILDLAVRGQLVEQYPKDEPATELIKRIAAERACLAKAAKARSQASAQSDDDKPYELPDSWSWTVLSEVAQYGLLDKVNSNKEITNTTWVLDLEDIEKDTSRLIERVSSAARPFRSTKTRFKRGDVLFGKLRPYLNKVIVADADGVCTTEIVPIRGYCNLDPEYIKLVLKSPLTMERVERLMYGMKMPRLGTDDAKSLFFPLPPLTEQHRIMAKVDELMKLCDELEAAQEKRERRRDRLVAATLHGLNNGVKEDDSGEYLSFEESARFFFNNLPRLSTRQEHIQQLRQTILNLAARGKLVPQDPMEEPAIETLQRIKERKELLIVEGKLRKEKILEPIAVEGTPFSLPSAWKWAKIGDWSLSTDYGTSVKSTHTDMGVPVLSMGDIQNGRAILGGQKKVPRSIDDLPHLFLKQLDLLYNRTNSAELVGKTGIFMGEDDTFTFASYLIRIRFDTELTNPLYANLAMNAPYFRETQIVPELKQQCGQANVNGTKLKNMLVPVPPLKEQYHIVAKVDELMKLCDELEARVATTSTIRHDFLLATLEEALSY